MRPDRFGTFDGKEFGESVGRERDHAFSSIGGNFPAVVASVTLTGFMGFQPVEYGPDGFGWGSSLAYGNISTLPKIYRKSNHVETSSYEYFPPGGGGASFVLGSRELSWEYDRITAQTNTPITSKQTFVGGNNWSVEAVLAASGLSLAQFSQTETTRHIGNRKNTVPPDEWNTDGNTTVSKPINAAPWIAMLRDKLNNVTEFPGRYQLQLKPDAVVPVEKENPDVDDPNYELVRIGGQNQTAAFASFSIGQGLSVATLPTEAAGTTSTTRLLVNVVSGALTITMVKILIRTIDNSTGVGLLSFADWVVGRRHDSIAQEMSCGRMRPIEVLNPPDFDVSSLGFESTNFTSFLRFAFPVTPVPPASTVGGLVPTCSPTYT